MTGDRKAWPVLLMLWVAIVIATGCGANAPTPTAPPATPTIAPLPSPTGAAMTSEGLQIVTEVGFTDAGGTTHVIGEVENTGQVPLRPVEIACAFYDAAGATLAERETRALVDILYPGERAPFKLSLLSPPPAIASYAVSARGAATNETPLTGIAFVQDQATMDEDDMTIVGEIVNNGEQPAYRVSIAATILDGSGALIDVGAARAERTLLLPGESSPFKIYVGDAGGMPDHYALIAYGERASPEAIAAAAQIELDSAVRCPAGDDRLVLCGEVTNRSTDNATYVKAIAAYYDAAGNVIDADWSYVWANVLAPGERSPFAISLYPVPVEVAHWFIWVQGERTDQPAEDGLAIEGLRSTVDGGDLARFEGQVRNGGPAPMTAIEVAITLYDGDGEVTSVYWTQLDDDLAPNATTPFEIEMPGAAGAQAFGAYVQGSAVEN